MNYDEFIIKAAENLAEIRNEIKHLNEAIQKLGRCGDEFCKIDYLKDKISFNRKLFFIILITYIPILLGLLQKG